MLKRMFLDHPASVDETYGEHMAFAGNASFKLFKAAFACLVHASFQGCSSGPRARSSPSSTTVPMDGARQRLPATIREAVLALPKRFDASTAVPHLAGRQ